MNAVKNILHIFNLNLEDCHGQTYGGASNILGQHSGVVTQILAEKPKAVVTHCHGHSLSLSVKSVTSSCNILKAAEEICIFVKYSPKWEKILGKIVENIEADLSEELCSGKISKLPTIRRTVRATSFKKLLIVMYLCSTFGNSAYSNH